MSTKYPYLRLVIPSLSQDNDNGVDSDVWCGRAVAAMIQNYYIATRKPGGFAEAKGELIINQRSKPLYDLVFEGGPKANQIAVRDYNLLEAVEQQKAGFKEHFLFPEEDPARGPVWEGQPLDEAEVVRRLGPVIRGLELFNPAMIYTALSSSTGLPNASGKRRLVRHLVCVSGYRRDSDGSLWLHIDDPSSTAFANGVLRELTLEKLMEAGSLIGIPDAIAQLYPDCAADEAPGRRYWLRAAALFQPNLHSQNPTTDFWCDHEDTPGFRVYANPVPELRGSMVELSGDPRYPVCLSKKDAAEETAEDTKKPNPTEEERAAATAALEEAEASDEERGDVIPALWDAVARSGDPYPLSSRRSWHNGIHIPDTAGVTTNKSVYTIAPGRVVLAWFPERKPPAPDRGMVIVRHAIDLQTLCFVDAREAEPPDGTVLVFSLYANLAGGETGAAPLLKSLAPVGTEPQPRQFARAGAPKLLLTETGAALKPAVDEGLPKEQPESGLVGVPDTTFYAVPQETTFVSKWTDAEAATSSTHPSHAVRERLESKESRLVGVQLDGKPWILDGDMIKVKEGTTDTDARLFRAIKGSGETRYFPEWKPGRDYVDVTIDASTTLRPVEVFHSNSLDRALVEIRDVVDGLSDNSAEITAWQERDKLYSDVLARVCGASYADLGSDDAAYLDVVSGRIGTMGVQRDDTTAFALGVHVEMFSEKDLTASAQVGGRWSQLVEALGFDNGTADFFKAQLDALLSASRSRQSVGGAHTSDPSLAGPAGDAQPTSLLSLLDDGTPITIEEWRAYCAVPEHARELSQIVAKHRSEWTLELVKDASNSQALEGVPAELRKALFPPKLALPGLGTDTFYYFHPLRLIEWLRTGIDVGLHDPPNDEARSAVSLVLRLGDTEIDLVRQGESDNYRLRLVLGDGTEASEQDGEDDDDAAGTSRAVLVLSGIDTANPEIEVELTRNSVTGLSFTWPGGGATTSRQLGQGDFGVAFACQGILAADGEENVIHIASDSGGPLPDLACGRATVIAEVRYNVAPPNRMMISLPGDGFVLESLEVSGATVDEPPGGWAAAADFDVPLHALDDDGDEDDEQCDYDRLVTASSTVLVKATIVPLYNTRAREPVQIELSGGDLLSPVVGKWEVSQRDIEYGARGNDVAKLQLYLTQILCGTFGCLRGKKGPAASIDGDYGPGTSLALWRFLLFYRAWSGPDHKVPTSSSEVELDGLVRTDKDLEAQATALHDAHKGPKVTQELLDLVVSYYRLPYVGIAIAATILEPTLRHPVPEVAAKWSGWSSAQRTRVPPLPDAVELHIRFDVKSCDTPGTLASVPVTVELSDAAAYRLVTTNVANLSDLVELGLTLVPSGALAPDAKPKLVVRAASGGELVALTLGGATDVRTGATEVGLDAALIQKWLTQYPDKKGKPYLGGVDGEFGSGSKKVLETFIKDEFKKSDDPTYVQILEQLRLAEDQPCEEEAAQ